MSYCAYLEYGSSVAATGVAFPSAWPVERLRFSVLSNPVRSEVAHWENETFVSFVPMDAVGEQGEIDASQEKQLSDVYNGYTYFVENDILIAKITPCFENGKGAIARGLKNGVGFGTTEFHVLRPLQGVSERWLFYLTKCDSFRKIGGSEMLGAGGQKRLPEDFIRNLRVGIPSLPEQEKIATFLDWKTAQIDVLITKKQALIEKLKEKRLAVITRAVTKGLDPSVEFRDSGIAWLGRVPKYWDIKRLRFAAEKIEQGWSPQCDNQPAEDEAWGVMKVGCVNGDQFDPLENKALPLELAALPEYELRPKEILVSRANTKELLGSAAIVPENVRSKLLLCDKLFRLRPVSGVDEEFLTCYLRTPAARYQYEREATGASGSMQNIGQGTLKNLIVPLPPLDEQKQIYRHISCENAQLDALTERIGSAIARLTEYRTALITAATTGQIDVRNVKIPAQA